MLSAEPIYVPRTEDKGVLDACRKKLEHRLNTLAGAAAAFISTGPEAIDALLKAESHEWPSEMPKC